MSKIIPYYEEEGITIYCGDCRDILPLLRDTDLVVTDPPYGINYSSGHGATWQKTTIAGDNDVTLRDEVIDHFHDVAAFGSWKTPPIKNVRGALVWNKGPAFGMGDLRFPWKPSFDLIFIKGSRWVGRREEGVLSGPVVVSWESRGRMHPNQKPIWIFQHLIAKHVSGTVVDPFMGSGTALLAARNLGRKAIGIEIEQKYCDIAIDRLRQEVLQLHTPVEIVKNAEIELQENV